MKKLLLILAIILCTTLVSCVAESDQTESTEPTLAESTDNVALHESEPPTEQSTSPSEGNGKPYGGTGMCNVHTVGYHFFSSWLINYVGQDNFNAWMEKVESGEAADGCPYPDACMYDAIREFNIPREVFEENYYAIEYFADVHNIDLLYGDDKEAVDKFYRNTDELQVVSHRRQALHGLKYSLFMRYIGTWDDVIGHRNLNKVSVEQIVNAFDVPRDTLERLAKKNAVSGEMYDYDYDVIYSKDGGAVTPNGSESDFMSSVFLADAAFCGIENYMTD